MVALNMYEDFTDCKQKLLARCSGAKLGQHSRICLHHEAIFLTKYEALQNKCCNPFGKIDHIVKTGIRATDAEISDKVCSLVMKKIVNDIKPDQKLCPFCKTALHDKLEQKSQSESHEEFVTVEEVNSSLSSIGISPLKRKLSGRNKKSYAKHKIRTAHNVIENKIATVIGVHLKTEQPSSSKQCENCVDFKYFLEDLKGKIKESNRKQNIQLLSLGHRSWTITKTAAEFCVSERIVKHARKLKADKGILAHPANRKGRKLSAEVCIKVQNFFEDNEFSRLCSGKDSIPMRISRINTYKQKRLLLCNLWEMYVHYSNQNGPEIGFSKFCELKPKWCIGVGSAGTYAVCVCTLHQNIKLMLSAIAIKD
ncbi:hypothetical protein PR048_015918 [Dryococelus australis]|uniref:Transposase n=1 Tax=Dryococelus australis TaxID=614101 RepID=A0ABQ9HIT3_9NEOP|nr:hypothetical protein PR048_015918 [Dryococelus australis]